MPAKIALEDLSGIRNGKHFKCPSCNWSDDADFNGAKNIAFLGLHADQPEGSERPSRKVVNSGLSKALSLRGRVVYVIPICSFIALISACTCLILIPCPGWMSSLKPFTSSKT